MQLDHRSHRLLDRSVRIGRVEVVCRAQVSACSQDGADYLHKSMQSISSNRRLSVQAFLQYAYELSTS